MNMICSFLLDRKNCHRLSTSFKLAPCIKKEKHKTRRFFKFVLLEVVDVFECVFNPNVQTIIFSFYKAAIVYFFFSESGSSLAFLG